MMIGSQKVSGFSSGLADPAELHVADESPIFP